MHFNRGWVPYEEREAYLLESDIGVCAHHDHLEARFSFRTRVLDHFWAGLPSVVSGGDAIGDLVDRRGLGHAVAPGDAEGFAAGLRRAARRRRRPTRRRAARARAGAVAALERGGAAAGALLPRAGRRARRASRPRRRAGARDLRPVPGHPRRPARARRPAARWPGACRSHVARLLRHRASRAPGDASATRCCWLLGALLSGLTIRWGINPHDEGLMLQAGERIADGQLPYRDFYANYGPGQYFLIGGLDCAVRPLAAHLADRARAARRRRGRARLRAGAPRRARAAGARRLAGGGRGDGVPEHPAPQPDRAGARLRRAAARRSARPVLAGALAGLAVVFRLDLGLAALAGAALLRRAGAARGARRAGAGAARRGCVLLAPVVLAAPGDFWDQTIGFALDEQGLQRLPLPGAWDGGFEPNKILEHYFPYVLLAGAALWLVVADRAAGCRLRLWAAAPLAARRRRLPAGARRRVPPRPAGRRAAGAAGHRRRARAARRPHRLDGSRWSAVLGLIALQGLDRKRIQLLDPPPLATIDVDVADGVKAPTAEARALDRAGAATCARASRPASRCSWPTRASTWSGSATRSSTCWSAAPTRPATT